MPRLAMVRDWHNTELALPDALRVTKRGGDELEVAFPGGVARFWTVDAASLTSDAAQELVARGREREAPLLVTFTRSTDGAREILRGGGVSYVGEDGYAHLVADGLYVERGDRRPVRRSPPRTGGDAVRNPFAGRASRIARWMLLNPETPVTAAELARRTDLSPSLVSRAVRALEEDGWVATDAAPRETVRTLQLRRPRPLLDEWAAHWTRRRFEQHVWDVGTRSATATMALLAELARDLPEAAWAVGGLAGAAAVRRVVEPSDVLLWVAAEAVEAVEEALRPAAGRRLPGALRVVVPRDPWPLALATQRDGLPVADPVQLYLDCLREGERALEAADAVARSSGW